jgi:tetratricopeptide (TPR) repeat protein
MNMIPTTGRLTSGAALVLASLLTVPASQGAPAPAPAKKAAPQHPSVKPHQPPQPQPKKTGKKRRPPGVRGMFEVAQEFYEAGKYPQALQAYDTLLRKYPGHEPAVLQLAKTLYRMDRIKDAYGVFTKINPQHLDPETAYEYGWSFYTNKAWEGALYGFQRVPKGHALFDLANYYGAICAIKLKKYEDAEDMLEKAVVLPDKLAKSRTLYIRHVQALRLLQQKSALAKDRDAERKALKDQKDQANAAKAKPEKDDKAPWTHGGSKSISRSAVAKYAIEQQYYDNHGLEETTFDAKVASLEVKSGVMGPMPMKLKDRSSAGGIQVSLGAEDRITKGSEQRILIDESNEDLARVSSKDLGTTDVVSGKFTVEPWFEFPLPEGTWMNAGGEVSFTYPEFERGNRTGYRKGYTGLNGDLPAYSWGTDLSYTETLDTKTKPYITTTSGSANISGDVIPQLKATVKVWHDIFDYLDPALGISGPDTQTTGQLALAQALPLGSKITAQGEYSYLGNYIFYGMPTYGQLSANGSAVAGKLTVSSTPVPWFTASISQLIIRTTWQQDNEAAKDVFERNVTDYVEKFTAWASINLFY